MLKKLILAFALASVASAYQDFYAPNGDTRLCPEGYFYAGEDTKDLRDIWLEEYSRSPTYSCYKVFEAEDSDYFKASRTCEEDKGHLISLEDQQEIQRVQEELENKTISFMTSAIFLYVENEWSWMGTNKSFDPSLYDVNRADLSGSCLRVNFTHGTLSATNCFDEMSFICETRVQTVAYYAWFVANWFSLLLVFLVVVLLISLCITTSMYKQRRQTGGRIYRASGPVFEDKPPSYQRATGQNGTNSSRYLNKGREFLSKVSIQPRA